MMIMSKVISKTLNTNSNCLVRIEWNCPELSSFTSFKLVPISSKLIIEERERPFATTLSSHFEFQKAWKYWESRKKREGGISLAGGLDERRNKRVGLFHSIISFFLFSAQNRPKIAKTRGDHINSFILVRFLDML